MIEDYVFCIPSYNRPDSQTTVKMLNEWGVTRDKIIISLHDDAQLQLYTPTVGDVATLRVGNVNNVGASRNFLLTQVRPGQKVVMLDDDVKAIQYLDSSEQVQTIQSGEEFGQLLDYCFTFATKNNAMLWGTYAVNNPFFMSRSIDMVNVLVGTFIGLIAGAFNFDREYAIKEDMELCLREMQAGLNVIRYNFIVPDAKHKSKGGCSDAWKSGIDDDITKRLCRKYPSLIEYAPSKASKLKFKAQKKYKGKIEWK